MKLKKNFILIISILLFNFFTGISLAVEPNEILEDSNQEARARNISKKIRCMVCQNQSIDESTAPLAKDLRILIRNKVTEGSTDKEIYKFLTDRYGNFILLKPPFDLNTLGLWFLPFIFIVLGIYVVFYHNKKSS